MTHAGSRTLVRRSTSLLLAWIASSLPVGAAAGELEPWWIQGLAFAESRVASTVVEVGDPDRYPKSTTSDGTWSTKSSGSWTSGFFPGCLWMLHGRALDPALRQWAEDWTAGMEGEKDDTGTHDVGFKVFGSFGNGYRITGEPAYRDVILQAAASLASRYSETVGCVRSWDNRHFPVIIDNMMNLELLFWAARNGGDPVWYDMALSHASRTRDEHVRPDGSTFQIVDFDPDTGAVLAKESHQGFSTESTWSRGQAWGLYGFTVAYRETGSPAFLSTARLLADYFLANLPADHVPYWDFQAPGIPDEERDTSAAAIAASGLLELAELSPDGGAYRAAAADILASLCSPSYLADGSNSSGILLHGVGNRPNDREVDVSLIYGDYYFIEALLRYSTPSTGLGQPPLAHHFRLHPVAPNPFAGSTLVRFEMSAPGLLSLSVHDVGGRRVRSLIDEVRRGGTGAIRWDGRDDRGRRLGSGVYFLRAETPGSSMSRRIILRR